MLKELLKPFAAEQITDFWAKELGLIWTWHKPIARIVKRQIEAKDTVSLWLKPNRRFLGFNAGQHINLTVQVNGVYLTRSYSLSHAPQKNGLLRITIKQEAQGKVSQYLTQQAQVGDTFEISQAFGEFSLSAKKPNLLLAAGSGITPLMSLSHTATSQTTLLYWAKTRAELSFIAELKQLKKANPLITVHYFLTQEKELLSHEHHGRISEEILTKLVPDLENYHVLACGNSGFVEQVKTLTSQAPSLQVEAFTPLILQTTDSTETVQVYLSKSQKTLSLPQGQSLLNALEEQGVYPPSGCRMGICHSCSCQKQSGTTQDLQSGEINQEPNSAVRLCVSRPQSDLVLEI